MKIGVGMDGMGDHEGLNMNWFELKNACTDMEELGIWTEDGGRKIDCPWK